MLTLLIIRNVDTDRCFTLCYEQSREYGVWVRKRQEWMGSCVELQNGLLPPEPGRAWLEMPAVLETDGEDAVARL